MSNNDSDESATVLDALATAVLAEDGTVLRWSRAAADLLGFTAGEICGGPFGALLDNGGDGRGPVRTSRGLPPDGRARLRRRTGDPVQVHLRAMPLEASSEFLLVAAPSRADAELGAALVRSLLTQNRVGVTVLDADLAVVRTNVTPEMFGGPALTPGNRMHDVMVPQDAESTEAFLRQVLETGAPQVGTELRMRSPLRPGREWTLSVSACRLADKQGLPTGVALAFTDATGERRVRRQLGLLHDATERVGSSLDATRTAQQLVDLLVPAFGDLASVDLAEAVLAGDEPPKLLGGGAPHLRRVAVAAADGVWPAPLLQPGAAAPALPDVPNLRLIQAGEVLVADRAAVCDRVDDPRVIERYVPEGGHSMAAAPLYARGLLLGAVIVWRTGQATAFDDQDGSLLAQIASRAALGVDNARRYTREHRAAVALQQRLLPPATTDTPAARTAGVYLPAGGGAEIGGDWFDVLPLPSLRSAFVVGDVIGHGLPAAATMGRLRTAIHTLADLELDPAELLIHLDDLVQRIASESGKYQDTIGATCLYAVYDPVTRHCTLGSAGHAPPVVVDPDTTSRTIHVSPGPPLGVGGMAFENVTFELPPGSILALYTDGLVGIDDFDGNDTPQSLQAHLTAQCRAGRPLAEIGRAVVAASSSPAPRDDVALLLARTRALSAEDCAQWEFPADLQAVAQARKATARQLADWGLDDLSFTSELIVSELVTNAVRYAGGPVGLRLLREKVLVCEVSDPSNTQPRLRRARTTDEGGRGLFLVAQYSNRWGSRYGRQGKTIWAEQLIDPTTKE